MLKTRFIRYERRPVCMHAIGIVEINHHAMQCRNISVQGRYVCRLSAVVSRLGLMDVCMKSKVPRLPALRVVAADSVAVEVLVHAARVDGCLLLRLLLAHVGLFGVLLEVGDIVRGVSPLQDRIGS